MIMKFTHETKIQNAVLGHLLDEQSHTKHTILSTAHLNESVALHRRLPQSSYLNAMKICNASIKRRSVVGKLLTVVRRLRYMPIKWGNLVAKERIVVIHLRTIPEVHWHQLQYQEV